MSHEQIAVHICREVAELPDRSSPDGWPEAMLVTQDELQEIVLAALRSAAGDEKQERKPLTRDKVVQIALGGSDMASQAPSTTYIPFARAIEAAHGIGAREDSAKGGA